MKRSLFKKDRWDTWFIFYICVYRIMSSFLETGNSRWIFFFFLLSVSLWTQECSHRSFTIFNMLKHFRVLALLDGQIILFLKLTSRTLQKNRRDLSSHLCFLLVEKDFLDSWNSSKSGMTCFSRNLWFLLLKVVLYMTILSVGKTIN